MKNCFTCANFKGFEIDEDSIFECSSPYKYVTPKCDFCETEGTNYLPCLKDMSRNKWNLACEGWKLREGYIDKQSYIKYCNRLDSVKFEGVVW
jgi:hypothetical protein